MLLLAHSERELNIFSLGLSPDLEAEEKMWRGVGRGLESEMRSRDASLWSCRGATHSEATRPHQGHQFSAPIIRVQQARFALEHGQTKVRPITCKKTLATMMSTHLVRGSARLRNAAIVIVAKCDDLRMR